VFGAIYNAGGIKSPSSGKPTIPTPGVRMVEVPKFPEHVNISKKAQTNLALFIDISIVRKSKSAVWSSMAV
jgi:hypothetical protein